jgi:hypothetical protein
MEGTTWTIGGYGVWNIVWLLVIAGVCGAQRRGNTLSHSLVDHRIGAVRRRHQPDFPLSPMRQPIAARLVDITGGE